MTPTPPPPNPPWTDRPWLGPLLLAAVVLGLFASALFGPADRVISAPGGDVTSQFLGWREYGFERLRDGDVPLWNPYLFSGQPFLGNWQTALFYPPNWLHLVLPAPRAINLLVAAHVYLAGLLTRIWLRGRGYSPWAATLGGGVFMLSAPLLGRIFAGHLTWIAVVAWMPLVLLCLDRLLDTGRYRWAWLGTATIALQILAGYPQPVFITLLTAIAYGILCGVGSPHRWRAAAGLLAMVALGGAIAAVQLLPGIETGLSSSRAGGATFDYAASYALPPQNLLLTLAPLALGGPSTNSYGGEWFLWEVWPYFGAVAALMAFYGGLTDRSDRRRWAGTLVLLSVLLALGPATPLFRIAYEAIPGLGSFRVPGRFLVVAALFGSVLVASAVESARTLSAASHAWLRRLLAVLCVGMAAVLITLGVVAGSSADGPGPMRATPLYASAGVLIATALLLFLWQHRLVPWALGLLAAAEILLVARVSLATGPAYPPVPLSHQAAFASLPTEQRIVISDISLSNLPLRLRLPGGGMAGYDPLQQKRFVEFIAATQGEDPREVDEIVGILRPHPAWRLLRAGLLLTEAGHPVLLDAPPLPRVLLVHRAQLAPLGALRLARLMDPAFDPYTNVLLEEAPRWPDRAVADAADDVDLTRTGSATLLEDRHDLLRIQVDSPRLAVLLITDAYAPGWRAVREDTAETYPVVSANHLLRGVAVPPGNYILRLEYAPVSWLIGRWLSPAGLAVWGVWGAGLWLRRNVR